MEDGHGCGNEDLPRLGPTARMRAEEEDDRNHTRELRRCEVSRLLDVAASNEYDRASLIQAVRILAKEVFDG